jgi:transposase InsO family protein
VLAERGIEISEYKVKMLMRESGLYPVTTRKYKPYPKQKSDGKYSEDKVLQGFNVDMPDKIWAGDITYIKTALGWVYLAVVIDLYNREVVGYSISKKIDTELVKRSVCNGVHRRNRSAFLYYHMGTRRKN